MLSRHRPHRHRVDSTKVPEGVRWRAREATLAAAATATRGAGRTGAAAGGRARGRIQLPRQGHGGRPLHPRMGRRRSAQRRRARGGSRP
eukprot:10847660-Alexandrium_andersonii.AAC.2